MQTFKAQEKKPNSKRLDHAQNRWRVSGQRRKTDVDAQARQAVALPAVVQ